MTLSVHRRAAAAALLCALAVIVTMSAVAAANVAQDDPTAVPGIPLISVDGDAKAEAGRPYLLDVTVEGIDQSQVSEWTVSWGDGTATKGTGSPGIVEHVYEHVGSAHQITVSVITSGGDTLSNAALVISNYDTARAPTLHRITGQPASDQLVGDATDNIASVLVGADGVLYAIDDVANTILRFDLDRKTRFEVPLDRESVVRRPRAMAFDAEGHLLVADASSNAIHQIDVDSGQIVRTIAGDEHLNRPSALIIGPQGDLYVTDAADDDIERFDFTTGRHVSTFATFEPGATPTSLVSGPNDTLLVSLPGAGRIASVSSSGQVANFGADVTTPDQLAVGPDGALWVSDYWNDTVERFDLKSGETLDREPIVEGTAGPRGLSFAPDVSVTVIAPSDAPSSDPSPDELTAQEWRESLPEDQNIDELIFVANDGEAEPQLDFIAQSDDYIAVIADNTIEVALDQAESDQLVTMELEDATEKPPSGASTDTRVAFDDVYDGIDAVYSDDEGELEYSFIIEPGADVDDISLDFGGAETLQITEQGDLFIDVSEGPDLLSTAPFTFQFIDGRRVVIESSYVIRPDGRVGFGLGAYDPTRPVVIDPTLTAATNLLMVTGTGTAVGTDATKQALFQSWGWTVTLIDDDSVGSFAGAAAANDVLYVSGTARFDIAYDVRDLDIGIVNENFSAWNGLLNYGSQPQAFTTGTTLNIVDNSHYITSPFATGSLAIHSVGDDINYWPSDSAPLPAGVTVLAESPTSTNHEALHVAETGTTLYSAFTAVNRRVWFPSDYADPANYTTDYETLLERSLDWAAGNDAPPAAPQSIAVANPDTASTAQDLATTLDPSANDADAEGDPIVEIDVTDPANGSVVINGDETVTYTPDPGYTGSDSFDYWAIDSGAGLTNYWGLAGGGIDSVGSANGALSGTTTVPGDFGDALSFNEINDRVTVPDFAYGSDFSLSFEFKLDDNTGSLFQYVYSHGDINAVNSVNVFINEASHGSDPNILRTVVRDGNDTLDNAALQTSIASFVGDGLWHTYTVTADSSAGLTVSIDGVAVATDATRGTGVVDPTGSAYFGTRQDLAADRWYGGSLDSVQIYNRALTGSEVTDLHAGTNRSTVSITVAPCTVDTDGDGLWDCEEDANTDADGDPATNPGPDTDGDTTPNYLDNDDDDDGALTSAENADPNSDGDPRDAQDTDHDGEPDYLDTEAGASRTPVAAEQKISNTSGGLTGSWSASDWAGTAVASIGDLDGDGITDIAVGTNGDDDGGANHGAVWVLFLNADGTVRAEQKISDTAGGFTGTLESGDQFGSALTGPGDIDGDGIPDLVVGARLDDDGGSGRGAAYILFLNTDGTVRAEQKISDAQGGLATTLDTNDEFGHAVEGIGDLDGDGIPDIAVGAWGDDDGGSGRGAVYILFLNSDGTVRAEQKISDISGGLAASIPDGSNFGVGLGDIGDVDSDGITDLAVGAWNDTDGGSARGAVYVLMLNADGTVAGEQKISATAGGFGGTLDASDDFGAGVSGIGDVDGDGTPDLAVGAPRDDDGGSSRGAVWLLTLNTDGTVGTTSKISSTAGGLTGPLDDNDQFGYEVTSLGDLDDDGSLNLLVGAWGDSDGASAAGAGYILDLSPPSSTVTVNSTGDLGDATPGDGSCDTGFLNSETNTECTLRAAIEEANASAAIDTIHLDIPTSDSGYAAAPLAFTITPGSVLPAITSSVVLDATTQSEYAGRPVIQLDGKDATGATAGILIHADDVTVSGFIVHSFDDEGIEVSNFSSSADRSTIINNWIGIDASEATRANLGDGVLVTSGSAANTIGSPGQGNVISGNVGAGVLIRGVDSDDNVVQANLIGVGSDGSTAVPNGSDGIQISDTTTGNRIGGTLATEANTIANNGGDGVAVLATAGSDNAVLRNEIHSNAGMGIDIDPNGVNANDPGDTDGPGPNDLLNYPSITSATTSGIIAILNGTYDVPAGSYRFDFYKNPSGADASGFGEGEQWVATSTLSHSGSGAEGWGAAFVGAVGDIITITVTEDLGGGNYGSTSEFSSAASVTAPAVVVNSTGDAADQTPGDGSCDTGGVNSQLATECTLRAAIEEANALAGGDTIEFNMPSSESGHASGVWTISPATIYPELTERVELDASSQPGFVGTPIVELDGSSLSVSSEHGLQLGVGSDGTTVRGLSISSFPGAGLYLEGSDSHTIAGNYIGLKADGSTAAGNRYGMYMSASSSTTIGGTTPADRNVISANTFSGVAVYNSIGLGLESLDTVIIGNYIGTDSTGMLARGNARDGLFVVNGSSRTQVGGSSPGEGNLISANTDAGVYVGSGSMVDTVVVGNTIGVSVDESIELPNEIGVEVGWSERTIVRDNVIGSATSHGVLLSSADNAVVAGNTIGTDAAGSAAWTIGGHGVLLENTSELNMIGGTLTADANTITNAALSGVAVPATAGSNNSILRNEIAANTGLGIDLDVDGVTPNSSVDGWLDYPDITSVVSSGGTLTTEFDLDVPAGAYRIEFFNNLSGADASGFGEGETFVHATTATHTGSGTESFSVNFAGSFGDIITATATQDLGGGSFGSTSEFSGAVAVLPVAVVNSTGDLGDATPGDDICDTGGTNSGLDAECTLRAAIEEANASADVDTIEFDMPTSEAGHSAGVWMIEPGTQLPEITQVVMLDASTQPGWTATPIVEIDGSSAGATTDGLLISGDDVTISGLAINRFAADGVKVLVGAQNTTLRSNHIGLDASGLIDRGNGDRGVDLQAGSGPTTVGGTNAIDRNVISGNGDDGIIIFGSDDNIVINNLIGTDVSGLSAIPNAADGVVLASGSADNTIGQPGFGNVLSGNANDGIEIDDTTGPNTIQSNIIGLGLDGDALVPNGRYGIVLYNGANTTQIGGGGADQGNVISGNATDGIYIDGNNNAATTANVIEGNLIGTDGTGTLERGNVRYGIRVDNAATSTVIGGPGAGNTISGNGDDGIYLSDSGTDNTIIQANHIGTNAAGDDAIPNGDRGVQIESGASFTQVGGAGAGEGNVISANLGDGVIIADWLALGTTGTVVEGNLIGVEADGSTPLGNGGHGVHVDPVTGNRIGGTAVGAGNVIANNGATGTQMAPTSGTNTVLGNSIYANADIGLGLGWDGVTPNDPGDVDSGPNGLLNFPEVTAASVSAGSVTVDFELDVPAGDYRIEFFTNPSGADPTGYGEGEVLADALTISHTGSGVESFSTSFAGAIGDVITATATEDLGGSHGATSEFSAAATATATDTIVNSTGDAGDAAVGDGVCDTGALNSAGVTECTLRAAVQESNNLGAAAIVFDIPATESGHDAGVWTISPSAPFDDLTAPVSIDGSTQPGWSTTPVIQIDGSGSGAAADGFRLLTGSDGSEIRSLSIGIYDSDALEIQSNDVVIAGNHLGLDAAGTTATPMATGAGVNISGAARTTIGGSTAVDRNVIAGGPNGVIVGGASTDTVIIGNYIGTDVTGSATAVTFSQYSIYVLGGSADTRIGGPLTTDRNIIASRGIYIRDETSDNVLIENNSIGVGADGTSPVSVASRAILVSGGSDDIDVIDNVIGNAYRAVEINGATTNSTVRGNTIGTDAGLTTDHGTTVEAIEISGGAAGIQIGGTTPAEANRIQFVGLGFPAISVADAATDDVHVMGNSILHDHGAIDLGADGPTSNDPGDIDGGANDLLNFPTLTVTNTTGSGPFTVDLDVTLDTAAGDHRIEIYSNADPGFGGLGKGEVLEHTFTFTHTGSGPETVSTTYVGSSSTALSATATEEFGGGTYGSTSEMSPIAAIAADAVVNSTGDLGDADLNDGQCDTGGTNSDGATECTFRAAIEQTNRAIASRVDFAIPNTDSGYDVGGYWTINQATDYEDIFASTTVDGSTQPGWDGSRPVVFINDNSSGTDHLTAFGDDVTLRSLALGNPGDDGVQIEGNRATLDDLWIGIDPTGADAGRPGTGNEGVIVYNGATDLLISDSRIAGFDSGIISNSGTIDATVSNTEIFNNRNGGIAFDNLGRVTAIGNSIHDNIGLGIDLSVNNGIPLPNDPGDTDTGGNDLLNYPVLTGATIGAGSLDITYDLDVPAGTYRIEFFDNAAPDPSGNGEGETFVASATLTHGGGAASYLTTIPGVVGDVITATATPDLGGGTYEGTSEFSNALAIGVVFVNSTADASDASAGDGACDTGGLNSDGNAECTLRAAIEETAANSGYDHIRFTIPETDPGFVAGAPSYWTISPATTLPFVSDTIEIDATTQPGWVDSPVIELDGSGVVSAGADGINLATGMTLRGFSITGWLDDGAFSDQDDIVVAGNWFGISPDGTPLANQGTDLVLYGASDGATIGGPDAADTNIFAAGGSEDGVMLSGDTTNAVVENNRFGVAADGVTGLGTATAELLVIVDNASDILVVDNQFGDAPNASVTLWADPTNVTIVGNIFGTDDTGTAVLPVGQAVYAQAAGSARFGGTTSSEWNTIRNVLWQAVLLDAGHTGSFSYLGNSMTGSGLYGIDLSGDGTTSNDAGDADSGPNDNLNVPEISSVVESGGTVRVSFGLDVPAGTYRIEAFTNPSGAHPTGFGEGEVFETSATITHAGSGRQSYEVTFPGSIGELVSLTTTQDLGGGLFGATSEFSQTVQATDPALILEDDRSERRSDLASSGGVSISGDSAPGQAGLAVHFDGSNDRFVGPAVDITDAALTMYASFNADGLTGDPVLLSKRTSAGSPIYELSIDSGTGEVVAEVRTNSGPAVARGGSIAAGTWHQALATWDGAELVLFVDGLEVDRVALTGALTVDVATDVIIGSTSTNSAPFDGLIDDVRVSHEATDSATADALAQNQTMVGFVSVGGEQTSAPSPWTTSSVQTRSGSFALSAPETSGSGAAAWAVATGIDEPGLVFESWWWFSSNTGVDLSSGTRAGEAPTDQYEAALTSPSGWELRQRSGGTGSFDAPAAGSPTAGAWVNVEIRTDQFGATRLFIDGSEVTTTTPQGSALLSGSMALRAGLLPTGQTWYIDDARGRKLVTPEPVTSVGPLDRN
ncbi:MAG: right-handed parallel beta-helix repeat-containing protein [Acidimicrobiia bacterium]|nr:right-handed parallel beta-helix repeat-containing protein [Acidimicrobiia bacterium]